MDSNERGEVVRRLIELLDEHYVFPEVAAALSGPLTARLADGPALDDLPAFAAAVTTDLQSVNGDRHLRLIHHELPLPEGHGEDETDLAGMRRWAEATCGGVARVQRLAGNVGYLELGPVMFPPAVAGSAVDAAMSLLSGTAALLVDLRRCLGGDPTMVALVCSYLFDGGPVELSGIYHRATDRVDQIWTLPHLPGRRYGAARPVYVLTSAATFSGAEHLAYDLRQMGRGTVVGERTRGGAHPRRGFRVHPHLEATIPVARAVSPLTGGNWEGTGVEPDVPVPAADAPRTAYRLAREAVLAAGTADGDVLAEARAAGDDPFAPA